MTLDAAIGQRWREYSAAVDRMRDSDSPDATLMREAVELVNCLRRLVRGRTPSEIHAAFGAPGDFGYETPIGDALALTYRGGQS